MPWLNRTSTTTLSATDDKDPRSMPPSQAQPLVSVIVIVYNDAARLPRAVASALGQSLRGLEVLIVDDCSTDDSFAVARRLEEENPGRVRALRLPANSGGCGAPATTASPRPAAST
ncbi:hypothetical protein GCM10025734_38850 [Kitasatospora paranensis]